MYSVRVGRVVPKTVAGLNLLVQILTPLSDVIVASWIKGGERVCLSYPSNNTGKTVHQPERMAVGVSGNHHRILPSSVHYPNQVLTLDLGSSRLVSIPGWIQLNY